MIHRVAFLAAVSALVAAPSLAALKAGDPAPDFKTTASQGGNVFTFSLAEALKHSRPDARSRPTISPRQSMRIAHLVPP